MKARKAALGTIAAGVARKVLASSKKGSPLRKKISNASGKVTHSLKETMEEVKNMFTENKEVAAVTARKGVRKTTPTRAKKTRSKK